MGPRATDGFTYSISGTGLGMAVEVGRPVEVGIAVGAAGAASVDARGAVPHPARITESRVKMMAVRGIHPPMNVLRGLYDQGANEEGRLFNVNSG